MIIFLDLPEVQVEGVDVAEEITLTLRTISPTASCPSCGTQSSQIQSRYRRTLYDLPSGGRPTRLIMHVRRFFCKKHTCAQKIFVERLPTLCRHHAQRTKQLQEALCQLGLRVGGQAGADVGSELGIIGSRDTILRLVRQSPPPARSEPHVIGLDDWAWKREGRDIFPLSFEKRKQHYRLFMTGILGEIACISFKRGLVLSALQVG